MRRKLKKFYPSLLLLSASLVLVMGCGRPEEEPGGAGAAGDAIVIEKLPQATEEMNTENDTARETAPPPESGAALAPETATGQGEGQVVVPAEELIEPEVPATQEPVADIPETKDENRLQIVFLGDSILDGHRDDTGIAYLTGVYCNADVYNMAIGGTTAALKSDESAVYENWKSRCMLGVAHVICGNVSPAILDGNHVREVYDSCDFSKTDYFVLEGGMNDFLSGIPISDDDMDHKSKTYTGALDNTISALRNTYPDATVVLCSPTYAQFWGKDGAFLGDGNMVNNGLGTLADYYRASGNVSYNYGTLFLDAYDGIGLNTYTADEWLEDGIHLTEKGRRKYAEKLSELILAYEAERNN